MTDRICSLCGEGYEDKTGHNYDVCVARCKGILEQANIDSHKAIDHLNDAHTHYQEAMRIQKQDWWKK